MIKITPSTNDINPFLPVKKPNSIFNYFTMSKKVNPLVFTKPRTLKNIKTQKKGGKKKRTYRKRSRQ
jgi:hypothetical protein